MLPERRRDKSLGLMATRHLQDLDETEDMAKGKGGSPEHQQQFRAQLGAPAWPLGKPISVKNTTKASLWSRVRSGQGSLPIRRNATLPWVQPRDAELGAAVLVPAWSAGSCCAVRCPRVRSFLLCSGIWLRETRLINHGLTGGAEICSLPAGQQRAHLLADTSMSLAGAAGPECWCHRWHKSCPTSPAPSIMLHIHQVLGPPSQPCCQGLVQCPSTPALPSVPHKWLHTNEKSYQP